MVSQPLSFTRKTVAAAVLSGKPTARERAFLPLGGGTLVDCAANESKNFVTEQEFLVICVHSCLFVVKPSALLESGSQSTNAVRVTVTETYFASSNGNFRNSMVIFCIRKCFSKCMASRSANVSIRFTD
jgi:hypothetical protein